MMHVRINANRELKIVANLYVTVFFMLLVTFGFLGLGYFFYQQSGMGMPFGILFMGIGVGLLVAVPFKVVKGLAHNGYLHLLANHEGLRIVSQTQDTRTSGEAFFSWDDVDSIRMARRYDVIDGEGRGMSWNQIVCYLRPSETNWAEKPTVLKTPEGRPFTLTGFPRSKLQLIKQTLRSVSDGKSVMKCERLVLDYVKGKDTVQGETW